MNPVSASELASIRADVQEAACDMTCMIQRKAKSSDGMLSETESWSTIATTVAGMTEPSGSQLQNFEYKIGSLKAWQVKMPVSTDVREQDHLIIDGKTLIVQVDLTPRSYAALLTLLASEVQ
jgi:hypothetical protein